MSKTPRRSEEPLDWNRYTDFRSRHSRDQLAQLCAGFSRQQLAQIFSTPDRTGLWPIHWAAIHNRSDLIEFMVEKGSPVRVRCRNRLFARGSPLHLAAMNGSIEAAGCILKFDLTDRGRQRQQQQQFKTFSQSEESTVEATYEQEHKAETESLLEARDAEGQTALMRCAAPRSRRFDTFRDLLRKNLWSLSGRPAEMALYLINHGADYHRTEPRDGMNLMHLAIVHDHDDIAFLLFNLDPKMAKIGLKLASGPARQPATKQEPQSPASSSSASDSASPRFDTVELGADNASRRGSDEDDNDDDDGKPLVSDQQRAERVLDQGELTPLQLAILYSRVSLIGLLWFASETGQRRTSDDSNLRQVLYKATWNSRTELSRFIRGSVLKVLLACDYALLALVWIPFYLFSEQESFVWRIIGTGLVIFFYCLTLALAIRVISRSPGYLSKGQSEYYSELSQLAKQKVQGLQVQTEQNQAEEMALINLKDSISIQIDNEHQQDSISLEERVRLLCHKCRCIRRPRSRHCNFCDHCIQDFDHHCIYLGCCVGRQNRLDFLIMMLVALLLGLNGLVFQATSLGRSEWSSVGHLLGTIWVAKYLAIGLLCSFSILRRASSGATMYEQIRSSRIRSIFGPSGPPKSVARSHIVYANFKDSYWRFSSDRYLIDGSSARQMCANLREFANFTSVRQYFIDLFCADSRLSRSHSNGKTNKTDN